MWSCAVGRQSSLSHTPSQRTASNVYEAVNCICDISFRNCVTSRRCRALSAAGIRASRPAGNSHNRSKKIGLDAPLFIQFLDTCPRDAVGGIEGSLQHKAGDQEGPEKWSSQQEQNPSHKVVVKQSAGGLNDSSLTDDDLDDVDTLWNEFELEIGKAVDLELDFLGEMFPAHRGLLTGRRVFSVGRQSSGAMFDRFDNSQKQEAGNQLSDDNGVIAQEVAVNAQRSMRGYDPEQTIAASCAGTNVSKAQSTAAVGHVRADVSDIDHYPLLDEQQPDDYSLVENEVTSHVLASKHEPDAQSSMTCGQEYVVAGEVGAVTSDIEYSGNSETDDSSQQAPLSVSDRLRLLDSKSSRISLSMEPESVVKALVQVLVRDGKDVTNNVSDIMEPYASKLGTADGNLMVRLLGRKMHFRQAFAVFEWMRSHDPPLVNSRSYSIILPILGKAGMIGKARLIFQSTNIGLRCIQVYNSYIGVLLDCGRQDEIDSVVFEMETCGIDQDAVTYSLYINRVVKEKRGLKEVLKLYNTMLEKGVSVNAAVMGSVVKAFCGEGRFDDALVFVKEMETSGLPPNTLVFNTLIDAFGKAGKLEVAEWLLVEMKKRKLILHVSTFNTLLNVYGKQGRLDVVEELFTDMQNSGLEPDVVTYTTLINSFGKKKMSEKAAAIYASMRKAGISPNAHTYTALIHAYSEAGWHTKAAMTFQNMKGEGITPTAQTYTALLEGYRQAGDVDQVLNVWEEMKREGCQGTRITYNTLLDAFAKQGHYKEARDVVHEYTHRGFQPNNMTYNMLINAYGRGGSHEKIPDLVKEMRKLGLKPDAYTYCSIIYAFFRMRDFTNVFKWFDAMLQQNQKPDPQTFHKLAVLVQEKRQIQAEMRTRSMLGQEKRQARQCEPIAPKQGGKEFWKTKKPRKAGKIRLKHKPKA